MRAISKANQLKLKGVSKKCYSQQPFQTFSGPLSFMRLPYTKDLKGVDVAISGVPFDNATTNRPGSRFGIIS